jgi:hypothetical protein
MENTEDDPVEEILFDEEERFTLTRWRNGEITIVRYD